MMLVCLWRSWIQSTQLSCSRVDAVLYLRPFHSQQSSVSIILCYPYASTISIRGIKSEVEQEHASAWVPSDHLCWFYLLWSAHSTLLTEASKCLRAPSLKSRSLLCNHCAFSWWRQTMCSFLHPRILKTWLCTSWATDTVLSIWEADVRDTQLHIKMAKQGT